MEWKLINPSDNIVFEAEDLRIATVACFIVGRGVYGADCEETTDSVPIFLISDAEEWCKETFKQSIKDLFATSDMAKVKQCLLSFRYVVERTSMNKIVDYAHDFANSMPVKEKNND